MSGDDDDPPEDLAHATPRPPTAGLFLQSARSILRDVLLGDLRGAAHV